MNKKKVCCVAIGTVVTVVGIIVIPPMIKKYGNKIYKSTISTDKIDFDDLGPEIVKR